MTAVDSARERKVETVKADDPQAALDLLVAGSDEELAVHAIMDLARWQGRVAYRLRERASIDDAVRRHHAVRGVLGPARELERRWLEAMRDDHVGSLDDAAARMLELGYVRIALEMQVDAALMAAWAGRGDERADAVLATCATYDCYPWLGPVSETRWLEAATVSRG